jgi:hypothetical protein
VRAPLTQDASALTDRPHPWAYDAWAAAYAEAGDFEHAIERQAEAIHLLPSDSPEGSAYLSRLESYRARRPDRLGGFLSAPAEH